MKSEISWSDQASPQSYLSFPILGKDMAEDASSSEKAATMDSLEVQIVPITSSVLQSSECFEGMCKARSQEAIPVDPTTSSAERHHQST